MTMLEVLNEIQKMPFAEQREIVEQLENHLKKRKNGEDDLEKREREFERKMFEEGFFSNIPTRDETDEEFDDFKLIEVEGEPLSEQIIRERR